ncbi:hypothetical protein BDF22DRAFT_670570 [Syncephalis plumigaleata]|nr:hypothetical protein BDF22DRAFT_670570 [Syncephalis plumigaleata]
MSKDKKEKKQKKEKKEKKVKEVDNDNTVTAQVEERNEPTENSTVVDSVEDSNSNSNDNKNNDDKENEGTTMDTDDKNDDNLMAVDLDADAPLSRKQRRLKKKEEKIEKSIAKEEKAKQESLNKPKRSEHGIWIGNLSYATNAKMLQGFFDSCGKPTRVHLPCSRPGMNRGFAYIDFETIEEVNSAIALSETLLDGRKVLIKNARDFAKNIPTNEDEGTGKATARPRGNQRLRQANPPAATLFVGNLPFSTVKSDLERLFSPFGKLHKVRLMTFEDSGKCKGFAYIDYANLESAKAAVESPKSHYLEGRVLRVEYGSEEAVKRGAPWIHDPKGLSKRPSSTEDEEQNSESTTTAATTTIMPSSSTLREEPERQSRRKRRRGEPQSSLAPPAPLRGPMAAVAFEGKKITFDED